MATTTDFLSGCCDSLYQLFQPFEGGNSLKVALQSFLTSHTLEAAQAIYAAFLNIYRMPGLEALLRSMGEYEEKAAKLLTRHRDHYIHSVDTYILGIAVYVSNRLFRETVDRCLNYPDAYPFSEEFVYRWGLTALFHDMGYPLELCMGLISSYSFQIIAPNLYVEDDVVKYNPVGKTGKPPITLNVLDYEALTRLSILNPKSKLEDDYYRKYPELKNVVIENAFKAIAWNLSRRLGNMTKDKYFQVIKKGFMAGLDSGYVDHAIISSAVFLRWINQFYLVSGWNPAYFYYPAIDAASAIYLHNTLGYLYTQPPIMLPRLSVQQHPVAFLLFFCDHLQEWGRKTYLGENTNIDYLSSCLEIDDQRFHLGLKPQPNVNESEVQKLPAKIEQEIRNVIRIEDVFSILSVTIEP